MIKDYLYDVKNLDLIGKSFKNGSSTSVFYPSPELLSITNIKSPMLIITREKEKETFMRELFKDTTVSIQEVNIESLSKNTKKIFSWFKEKKIFFYFMTKLDTYETTDLNIFNSIDTVSFSPGYIQHFNVEELDVEEVIDEINEEHIDFYGSFEKCEKVVVESIKSSLEALQRTDIFIRVNLDLHSEQFAYYDDKLYCIDPVIFPRVY